MKKYVFFVLFLFCTMSYGGNSLTVHAATQNTLSPAETATLSQTLQSMKAKALQLQTQLAARQAQNGQTSAPVISAQDTASLNNALTALGTVLSNLKSSGMINSNLMTVHRKAAMSSVLAGISANLIAMNGTLTGTPSQSPSAIAQTPATQAPIAAQPASGKTASVASAPATANQGLAQAATASPWNAWGWPIGIAIIAVFILWAWLRRERNARSKSAAVSQKPNEKAPGAPAAMNISSHASVNVPKAALTAVPQNVQKVPQQQQQQQQQQQPAPKINVNQKPAMSPLSSVVMGSSDNRPQTAAPQKFQEQKKAAA